MIPADSSSDATKPTGASDVAMPGTTAPPLAGPNEAISEAGLVSTNATILRDRARLLAQPLEEGIAQDDLEIVVFRLAGGRYAFETRQVREVFPFQPATPLPATPPWLHGILNVRGRILAVLDARRLLGLSEAAGAISQDETQEEKRKTPYLILRGTSGGFGAVGTGAIQAGADDVALLTEGIDGVHVLPATQLEDGHALSGTPGARYLRGLDAEGVALLDASAILNDSQLLVQDD